MNTQLSDICSTGGRSYLPSFFMIILLLVFSNISEAQKLVKKADDWVISGEYNKAINAYEKHLEEQPNDTIVLNKLGKCFLKIENYDAAELIWGSLVEHQPKNAIYLKKYAILLTSNHKLSDAIETYRRYLTIEPGDEVVQNLVQEYEGSLLKMNDLEGVEIINLSEVNTRYDDFAPFLVSDNFVFTSDRISKQTNDSIVHWKKSNHSSFYQAKFNLLDTTIGSVNLFEKNLPSQYKYESLSYDPKNKIVYFSRQERGDHKGVDGKYNHSKIYYYHRDKSEVELIPFPLNSDEYSVAYPSITKDGKVLFFASNKLGGQGGMDLYYCVKIDTLWSRPVNMGSNVNSSGDEVYPYAKGRKQIYFSSNGHKGYGGLDIFASSRLGKTWGLVYNLKSPINSSKDDFGVCFIDNNNGFLTSNRPGGKGEFDLFRFKIARRIISGSLFTLSDSTAHVGLVVNLLSPNKQIIASTLTNDNGEFSFQNLDPNIKYSIKLIEDPNGFTGSVANSFQRKKEQLEVYVYDEQGNLVNNLLLESNELFSFGSMDKKETDIEDDAIIAVTKESQVLVIDSKDLPESDEPDVFRMTATLLKSNKKPCDWCKVFIESKDKSFSVFTYTDSKGSFSFKDLKNNQQYVFKNDLREFELRGELISKNLDLEGNLKLFAPNGDQLDLIEEFKQPSNEFSYYHKPVINEDPFKNLKEQQAAGVTTIITNLKFELDSANLSENEIAKLDKLISFLRDNESVKLEINCHTDSRGPKDYNLQLSQQRANTVVDILTSSGIAQERLIGKGYGEDRLLNKCLEVEDCSEKEHARNRRAEFKFIWPEE